jgi:hypothetical protein
MWCSIFEYSWEPSWHCVAYSPEAGLKSTSIRPLYRGECNEPMTSCRKNGRRARERPRSAARNAPLRCGFGRPPCTLIVRPSRVRHSKQQWLRSVKTTSDTVSPFRETVRKRFCSGIPERTSYLRSTSTTLTRPTDRSKNIFQAALKAAWVRYTRSTAVKRQPRNARPHKSACSVNAGGGASARLHGSLPEFSGPHA